MSLAKVVGVTSETVARRISNLEAPRIITGYRLVIDETKRGGLNFYLLLYLNYVSEKQIFQFVEHCRADISVNYLIKALGEWDYELNVEVKNYSECRNLMMEITRTFPGLVRDYQTLPVNQIYKFMIMPPGAFD